MLKKELILILKSILTSSVISTVCSLAAYVLWNKNIYASFTLCFILQFAVYSFINEFLIKSKILKIQELELSKIEQLSTVLSCPVCMSKNIVTFIPDDNSKFEFVCENVDCRARNSVYMNFTVAHITEPTNNNL